MTSRATTSSSTARSRTRRRPTRTAAPGGPRRRISSSARWTRSRGSSISTRSSSGGRTSCAASRRRWRPGLRSTPATSTPRSTQALELLDYDGFRREQAERRERGDTNLLGVGFSTYVEMCGLAPSRILGAIRYVAGGWDAATIRFLPTGTVQAVIGTSPHGQGHVTTFSQIVADRLGVDYEDVEVLHGDTAVSPLGHGHVRQPQPRRRRDRALQRRRQGGREGEAHRGAPARGLRGGSALRGRHVHGRGHRPLARCEGDRVLRPGRRTTCRTGSSRGWTRRRSSTRRTSAGPRAATSPSSRSTPRPAPSISSGTSPSTMSAR